MQQITTLDGQTVQHLMTGDNQVTEVSDISENQWLTLYLMYSSDQN